MADSTDTAAKIEISPAEYRKILGGQFRAEVTETVWSRVRSYFTLGGTLSVGVLIGLVSYSANWLNGTVAEKVKAELDPRVATLRTELTATTQREAQAAVQRDITNVEAVRARVVAGLPEMMRDALQDPAIRAIIQAQANEQTAAQLRDPAWRRGIERSVMAQQAGDASQPPLIRLFAFTDLLRDPEGEAIAVRLLTESALRVPDRGLGGDTEEARFLGQAVTTYVGHLSRGDPSERFPAHEPLIRRLAALVAAPPQPGNAFEAMVQRFGSPLAISFLIRRARESTGAERDTALQALLTHPAGAAKEEVESRLCAVDSLLRADLVRAAMARPGALAGDAEGERFLHLVRCAEDVIAARRIPRVEIECLPQGDLSVPWQLSRLPTGTERAAAWQRAARQRLDEQLQRGQPDCVAAEPILRLGATALRAPQGWSTLLALPPDAGRGAPVLGLAGLLPAGPEGAAPPWLAGLAAGTGPMAVLAQAPERHTAHVSLLLERLSAMPEDLPEMRAARLRLAAGLAAAPVLPGRPTERLLLEAMLGGGAPVCAAVLTSFAESRAAPAAPAALAESIACLRGNSPLPVERRPAVLAVMGRAATLGKADREEARRALGLVALALGLDGTQDRGPAALLGWAIGLPVETDATAMAEALEALLALEGPGVLAGVFERPDARALVRLREQLAGNAPGLAPLRLAAPYLEDGFAARVPAAPAAPLAAGGRFWLSLRLSAPSELVMDGDPAAVLLRVEPLRVMALEKVGGVAEFEPLAPGTYLVGATRAEALASLRPRPAPPEAPGFAAVAAAEPMALGTVFTARLGPAGPLLFPYALEPGRLYEFATRRLEEGLDTVITLLDAEGREVPGASNDDGGGGLASRLCLSAPGGGMHWLRVENFGGPPSPPRSFELLAAGVAACAPR
jgi:hypothetical protein